MKEVNYVLSQCCESPVKRIGLLFYCMNCKKYCKIKDEKPMYKMQKEL